MKEIRRSLELFEFFYNDIKSENFTLKEILIYGFVCPLAFIAVAILASIIE